jgi:hypothetical protein
MNAGIVLATTCLGLLATGHSVLGERALLRPLFAAELPPMPLPPLFARRTLRFAWHLTSLAWVALAWALLTTEQAAPAVAALMIVSGLVTFASTRGAHFAWALFLAGGLGAAQVAMPAGTAVVVVACAGAMALAAIAALHVAWGLSLTTWGLHAAIPEVDGQRQFTPPRAATLAVAAALAFAAHLLLSLAGIVEQVPFAHALGVAAVVVFALRTVGDLRTAGLFKRVRGTAFARGDTVLFTPLCFALAAAFAWVLTT